ncbi:MAG: hypothetical protein IJA17_01085, partial [Oscillospiraceae bacterium]|nr:hypothetical protein [Oscillospiraceae bacterium]
MYPHFFDGAKKRRYPSKKRFPTPAVCSRSSRQSSLFSEHRFAVFLSRSLAAPLPQKIFWIFRGPHISLHKGTKTLHRENGDSDSRPPSFRPTAVFILHLPPGYLRLNLAGWDYNPSVISFRNATSLCTREAVRSILMGQGFPLIRQNLRFCHLPPREG